MKTISLAVLVDEMQMISEDWSIYHNRVSGDFISVHDDVLRQVEEGMSTESEDPELLEALDVVYLPR